MAEIWGMGRFSDVSKQLADPPVSPTGPIPVIPPAEPAEPTVTYAPPAAEVPPAHQQPAPADYYAPNQAPQPAPQPAPQMAAPAEEQDSFIPDELQELNDKLANTADEAAAEIDKARGTLTKLATSVGIDPESGQGKVMLGGITVLIVLWVGIFLDRNGITDWVPYPEKPASIEIPEGEPTTTTTTPPITITTPTTVDLSGLTTTTVPPVTTSSIPTSSPDTTPTTIEGELPETAAGELTFEG